MDRIQNLKQPDIRTTLTKDETISQSLLKDFQSIIKHEKLTIQTQETFIENLSSKVSKLENIQAMTQIFDEMVNNFKTIVEEQKKYVELIEKKVIPSLNSYAAEVKELKSLLQDYEKKHEIEIEKKQLFDAQTQVSTAAQQQRKDQLNSDYLKAKQASSVAGINLATKLRLYVLNRNQEYKAMIQHIVNKQMNYHAKALQLLSQLAMHIHAQQDFNESFALLETLVGSRLQEEEEEDKADK